jgi:glucose-1-phosphate thymidylyltransferase
MICIVLAAGYATRLYPLTESFPKPLLDVNGKTIIDWLLDDIAATQLIDMYVIISNHRYVEHFIAWADRKNLPITVLDDGSTCNDNRLGAVRDIQFAIDELHLDDDLFVIAGDNVLDFSLSTFVGYYTQKNTTCAMRYFETNTDKLRNTGVASVDDDDRIVRMEEKPANPQDNWCMPPFYIYKKTDLSLINNAIESGCNTDAPGSLLAWMVDHTPMYAMEMPGKRYDIGTVESYRAIQESYKGIK